MELLDKLELSGTHFELRDISWKLCPAINAARRMGSPEKAAALFFEKDPLTREKLAGELVSMNRQRKILEEEIWGIVEPMAFRSLSEYDNKLSLVYGTEINKGVTGLIAQRVTRRFNVPAIAVSFAPLPSESASAENPPPLVYTGSIRSSRGYNVCGLLEQCSDLFIDSGGHEFAGGFSLVRENWELFIERLKSAAYSIEFSEEEEGESIYIDAELPHDYLGPDILKLTDRFSPYGKDNEPLVFLAKNLTIDELNFVGKVESKHLKMVLGAGKYKWPAVYWDAAIRVVNREFGKGDHVDVVFNIFRDWYKGIATPQMKICDLKKNE